MQVVGVGGPKCCIARPSPSAHQSARKSQPPTHSPSAAAAAAKNWAGHESRRGTGPPALLNPRAPPKLFLPPPFLLHSSRTLFPPLHQQQHALPAPTFSALVALSSAHHTPHTTTTTKSCAHHSLQWLARRKTRREVNCLFLLNSSRGPAIR